MELKKNPKADLRKKSVLFLQIGLVLVLLLTWRGIEYKTYHRKIAEKEEIEVIEEEEIEIPITKIINVKPPPPPPPPPSIEIIKVVEDDEPEPETVFEETDVEEEEDIPEDIPDFSAVDEGEGEEEIADVPFHLIADAPVYPGCEKSKGKEAQKACMGKKINKYVNKKFDTGLADELGLTGVQVIYVSFVIDKTGNVTDVRARAKHPRLQAEALRVVKSLPKMKPGMQRNRPVRVTYNLPIRFRAEEG